MATLQEAVDRLTTEKLELETQSIEQAETCRELTEANVGLNARLLELAEKSTSSSDTLRKQLETQLAEAKKSLERAQEEIDMVRMSQQTQQMALLEELNTVQTENTSLRDQLRKK